MPMDRAMKSIHSCDGFPSTQLVITGALHFTPMLIRRDELVQPFRTSGAYFHQLLFGLAAGWS